MLVDLARNDIGRVCEPGSVQAAEFKTIERYSHVMHIVSQVVGKLKSDKNAFDLMRATFPAGTVSGAQRLERCKLFLSLNNYAGMHMRVPWDILATKEIMIPALPYERR